MAGPGHDKLFVPSWWGTTTPATGPTGTATIWSGVQLDFDVPGRVFGFRYYAVNGNDGNTFALLWDDASKELHVAKMFRVRATTGNQWHQTWCIPRFRVDTTRIYNLAVLHYGGNRFATNSILTSPINHNGVRFRNGFTSTALGVTVSTLTLTTNANAVDVLFVAD